MGVLRGQHLEDVRINRHKHGHASRVISRGCYQHM